MRHFLNLTLMAFLCVGQLSLANEYSITDPNQIVGKWLVTISIGLGVPKKETLQLRNTLVPVFSAVKGGLYKHSIDLDDHNMDLSELTKAKINTHFVTLQEEIQAFKDENPNSKTMLAFALTGHGSTDANGNYTYHLEQGGYSGQEIVKLVQSLQLDETILIVQSCQSGSLANNHFTNEFNMLGEDIKEHAASSDVHITVVTPVSKEIYSPTTAWETQILAPSFGDIDVDVNSDSIVSYEEWKNAVISRACQNDYYIPQEAYSYSNLQIPIDDTGTDPQFYDTKMPADLPMYLTESGVTMYNAGLLQLPAQGFRQAVIYTKTRRICDASKKTFKYLYTTPVVDLYKDFTTVNFAMRNRIMFQITREEYPLDNDQARFIHDTYKSTTNDSLKDILLQLLSSKADLDNAAEGTYLHDTLLSDLLKQFDDESEYLRPALINVFAKTNYKNALPLIRNIVLESDDELLKTTAISAIGTLGDTTLSDHLLTMLSADDSSEEIKATCAKSLALLAVAEASEKIFAIYQQGVEAKFRATYIYALGVLKVEAAVPLLLQQLLDPAFSDLAEVLITALGNIGTVEAIESLTAIMANVSSDMYHRFAAISALSNINSDKVRESLREQLKSEMENNQNGFMFVQPLVFALTQLKDPLAADMIVTIMVSLKGDQHLTADCARYIGILKVKKGVLPLISLLQSGELQDVFTRYMVVDALGKLQNPLALSELQRVADSDSDSNVREGARQAIELINSNNN